MHSEVYFPVHAVHLCWEHKLNIIMALRERAGGGGHREMETCRESSVIQGQADFTVTSFSMSKVSSAMPS